MEILIFTAIILVLIVGATQIKKTKDGRIKDESVTVKIVEDQLNSFVFNPIQNYTEKSVQSQLKKHLLERFVNVASEYSLGGIDGSKIDFEIGKKVGLEIKMLKTLFSLKNANAAVGQIQLYKERKYKDNMLVLIMAPKDLLQDTTKTSEILKRIKDTGVRYIVQEIND